MVHGKQSDRTRHTELAVDVAQSSLGLRGSAVREHHDRGARTTETRAKNRIVIERQRFGQPWHERRPRRLVPAIPERLAEIAVRSRGERMNQQQRALQVEDGITHRDRRRQHPARMRRFELGFRSRDDDLDVGRPAPCARRHPAIVSLTAHGQAAQERSGSVVGVAFNVRSQREQICGRHGRCEPRPARMGMSLRTSILTPGAGVPIRARA